MDLIVILFLDLCNVYLPICVIQIILRFLNEGPQLKKKKKTTKNQKQKTTTTTKKLIN